MEIKPHASEKKKKDPARNQKGNRKYCKIKYKHHTTELWDKAGIQQKQ